MQARTARARRLLGEQHRRIFECLELDRITTWILEKHGCLLTGLALEAHVGLDDELNACCDQLVCQLLPGRHWEYQTKMAYRNVVTVHQIGVPMSRVGRKMRDDLVSVKVEVDPVRRGTAFRATQQSTIECARLVQTGHRKSQVKREDRHEIAPD